MSSGQSPRARPASRGRNNPTVDVPCRRARGTSRLGSAFPRRLATRAFPAAPRSGAVIRQEADVTMPLI